MFERFGDDACRVVSLAQDEARLLAHTAVTSEHLVLALLHRSGRSVAAGTLHSLGVTLERARAAVEEASGRGSMVVSGRLPLTPSFREALASAATEALRLEGGPVGPEHILLALLRQPESRGTDLLIRLGAHPGAVRSELLRRTHAPPEEPGAPDKGPEPAEGGGGNGRSWASGIGRVLPPLLTSSARNVIGAGRTEARRMGQAHLGTQHLLLALASGVDEASTGLLVAAGVTPHGVRARLSPDVGEVRLGLSDDLPLTPRAKRVLTRSLDRAEAHGQRAVRARHLLLSLLADDDGAVGLILSDLGVPVGRLRMDAEALCRRVQSGRG